MDLSGSAEQSGDLKSVVLHSMTLANVKSDFSVPLGVKLTGVDSATYGLTGEAYSTIVPPMTESNTARILQKDDVALGAFRPRALARRPTGPRPTPSSPNWALAKAQFASADSALACVCARSLRVCPEVSYASQQPNAHVCALEPCSPLHTVCARASRNPAGYTAENLTEKGVSTTPTSNPTLTTCCITHTTHVATRSRSQIHEVQARRFCLIAADHPLVSAVSSTSLSSPELVPTSKYESNIACVRAFASADPGEP